MPNSPRPTNLPFWSLGCAVVLVALSIVGLAVIDLNDKSTPVYIMVVGLIVTTVPTLVSAAFAERVSRDIRNGTLTEKTKEGTLEALDETGITAAVEAGVNDPSAAIAALTVLLNRLNTNDTERNGT